jgi:hypothetical protein
MGIFFVRPLPPTLLLQESLHACSDVISSIQPLFCIIAFLGSRNLYRDLVAIVAKQFALCSRVGILVLPSHSRLMLLTQSFKCCSILLGEDENKVIAREEVKRQLSRSALGYNVTDFLLVLVVDILLVKQSGYGGDIRWLVNPPRASGRA